METIFNGVKIYGENRSKSSKVSIGINSYSASILEMGVKTARI